MVAGVVRGDGHDRPGAVARHHVVGDEDGQRLPVHGVDGVSTGEHAALRASLGLPLLSGLGGGLRLVRADGVGGGGGPTGPHGRDAVGPLRRTREERVDGGMLGRDHHVGCAEQGVGPGGEHREDLVAAGHREVDQRTLGAADPVTLHGLDLVGPVQVGEVVKQPVRVGGDAHHPLPEVGLEHGEVATLGAAVGGHLLVRQHRAEAGAPVDGHLVDEGEPVPGEHLLALRSGQVAPRTAVGSLALTVGEARDQLGDRACGAV